MIHEKDQLLALSRGDTAAFNRLYLQYQPKVVSFLTGFLHDVQQAEDLAQDVFFNLWKNRDRLAQIESFESYLYRVVRNALYNFYDHSLVCEKYTLEQFCKPITSTNPEEQLFLQELQALIMQWAETLPAQRQKVFRMSRIDGISNDEIATELQISKRTVENHLTSALAELRKILKLFIFTMPL